MDHQESHNHSHAEKKIFDSLFSHLFAPGIYKWSKLNHVDPHRLCLEDDVLKDSKEAVNKLDFHIEYEGEFLSDQTIIKIWDTILELSLPNYFELIRTNKFNRRKQLGNLDEYLKLLNDCIHFVQYLFSTTGQLVFDKFKISEELMIKSHDFHVHKLNQKIILIFSQLAHRIKTPKEIKSINLENLLKVLKMQSENLWKDNDIIEELSTKCQGDKQMMNAILKERSFDYLYLDTEYEKEDIITSVQKNQDNQQVASILLEFHNRLKKLIDMDPDWDLGSKEVPPPNIAMSGSYLALDAILSITHGLIDIISADYEIMTKSDREKRRAHKESFAKYISFRRAFIEEVEKLVDAGQKKVLSILGVNQELWDQSLKHYTDENVQEISLLPMLIIDKLKRTSIKTKKVLDLEKLISVLEYQLQLMKETDDDSDNKDDEIFKSVLEVQALDKIFEKYNVEEEDILISIKENGENEKVRDIMSKF